VWRTPKEKWRPECLGLRFICNGGVRISVSFWGCICYSGVGTITPFDGNLNTEKYISLLENNLWQAVVKHFGTDPWFSKMIIVHVTCHNGLKIGKIRTTVHVWTGRHNLQILNVIENVWRIIKIRLPREQHRIKTRQKFVEAVMRIWTSITPGYIQCLYKTLPDHLCAVLKAKVHATKYWKN
jgi:hypothetical protein